jgi:4-aminobutyrate aminotransferase
MAKGIASGMPMGAFAASAKVMSWKPGAHGSTFSGNPVCCAAGIATMELIGSELLQNVRTVGDYMMAEFKKMQKRHPSIGDIRGKGLMIGVELVKNRKTREKAPEAMNEVVHQAFYKGLLMLGCGTNTLRICPPLVITKEEAKAGMEIIDQVLTAVENKFKTEFNNEVQHLG